MVHLPWLTTECPSGYGMAACPTLGLLVTSTFTDNALWVWALPPAEALSSGSTSAAGLGFLFTLGGDGSPAPLQFKLFTGAGVSGALAFTPFSDGTSADGGPVRGPWLLVTDHGHNAVHLVDVVGRAHAGYLASPGSIGGPRGVAASATSPLVAVSAFRRADSGDHVIHLYRCSERGGWEALRVIGGGFDDPGSGDGRLETPNGLRLGAGPDGTPVVCVADSGNSRVSLFRVDDGEFVRHLATDLLSPVDVEEVEGGWLAACRRSNTIQFLCDDGTTAGAGGGGGDSGSLTGDRGCGQGTFAGLIVVARVPGLGLVARDDARLHLFAYPDVVAMASMSPLRVGWMVAVVRASGAARRAVVV
jgi:hypothetical protein